jgi:hypothetical protein
VRSRTIGSRKRDSPDRILDEGPARWCSQPRRYRLRWLVVNPRRQRTPATTRAGCTPRNSASCRITFSSSHSANLMPMRSRPVRSTSTKCSVSRSSSTFRSSPVPSDQQSS